MRNNNNNNSRRKKSLPASTNAMAKSLSNNNNTADTGRVTHLSQSTLDYSRCIANPFTGPVTGIPSWPSTLSFKQRAWAKGVLSTGTTGFGFITIAPYRFNFSNATGSVTHSDSTYTGTTIDTVVGPGVVGLSSNSIYSTGSVGVGTTSLQFRVVSCGLRIRYIGTELNRGGQIVGIMEPTHDSTNGRSFSDIDGEQTSVRFPVNRDWVTVLHRPVVDSELGYQTSLPSGHYMCFVIQAASPGTSLSYEFEAYVVGEFQGRNVRGMTPTAHDPIGFAAADYVTQTSRHLLPNTTSNEDREGNIVGTVAKYVAHGITHVTQHHAEHVKAIASAAASNSTGGSWFQSLWNGIKAIAPVALSILPSIL